jgi:tetratricopeptide (TPR) repeat protein
MAYVAMNRFDDAQRVVIDNLAFYMERGVLFDGCIFEGLRPLAMSYVKKGELDLAENVAIYAYAFDRNLFGDEHYLTARGLSLLGYVYSKKGNLEYTLSNLRKAVELRSGLTDAMHHENYHDHVIMATMLEERGKYAEALTEWKNALHCRWNLFSMGNPRMKSMKAHVKDLKKQVKLLKK